MARALTACVLTAYVLMACSREEKATSGPTRGLEPATRDAATSPVATSFGTQDAATDEPRPRGSAGIVIERIEAVCMVGKGANGKGHFFVGSDVIIEMKDGGQDDRAPAVRDFAYCPKELPDGGRATVTLGTWRNCRAFPSCQLLSDAPSRTEIECGKERVVIEVVGGRTILRGSFGERQLARHPMNVLPTALTDRKAMVDC